MDAEVERNRAAWEAASEKHAREYQELREAARAQSSLAEGQLAVLRPLLVSSPDVVHLQSGHGLDDLDLVAAGGRRVAGIDFSAVAVIAAQRRGAGIGGWMRDLPCDAGERAYPRQAAGVGLRRLLRAIRVNGCQCARNDGERTGLRVFG
jgi:hypothetical protein